MVVEAYWVPELNRLLVLPQDIHIEEGNPMSFQNHSVFEGDNTFYELMVKPKVKGYH